MQADSNMPENTAEAKVPQACTSSSSHRFQCAVFTSGQEAFKGSENTAEVEVPQACIVLIGFAEGPFCLVLENVLVGIKWVLSSHLEWRNQGGCGNSVESTALDAAPKAHMHHATYCFGVCALKDASQAEAAEVGAATKAHVFFLFLRTSFVTLSLQFNTSMWRTQVLAFDDRLVFFGPLQVHVPSCGDESEVGCFMLSLGPKF